MRSVENAAAETARIENAKVNQLVDKALRREATHETAAQADTDYVNACAQRELATANLLTALALLATQAKIFLEKEMEKS